MQTQTATNKSAAKTTGKQTSAVRGKAVETPKPSRAGGTPKNVNKQTTAQSTPAAVVTTLSPAERKAAVKARREEAQKLRDQKSAERLKAAQEKAEAVLKKAQEREVAIARKAAERQALREKKAIDRQAQALVRKNEKRALKLAPRFVVTYSNEGIETQSKVRKPAEAKKMIAGLIKTGTAFRFEPLAQPVAAPAAE